MKPRLVQTFRTIFCRRQEKIIEGLFAGSRTQHKPLDLTLKGSFESVSRSNPKDLLRILAYLQSTGIPVPYESCRAFWGESSHLCQFKLPGEPTVVDSCEPLGVPAEQILGGYVATNEIQPLSNREYTRVDCKG